jgi:hypothetical protein
MRASIAGRAAENIRLAEQLRGRRISGAEIFFSVHAPGTAVLEPDFHLSRPEVELLRQRRLLLLQAERRRQRLVRLTQRQDHERTY